MIDVAKALIISGGYLLLAPALGWLFSRSQCLEDFGCCLLIFAIGLHIDTTTLMLGSIEWYRGVTKGFEFTLMEMLSISLISASAFKPKRSIRWLPIGVFLWGLYVLASSLSILSALELSYVAMSIVKFGKAFLIVYAIFNYTRNHREVHIVLSGLSLMILFQFLVVAKGKWLDGIYQARGLFEHQNPLAMFTYMLALPLLAATLSSSVKLKQSALYLAAFAASGIIVLASLSRAALAVFAVGVAIIVAWSFVDRFSIKRLVVVAAMGLGGVVVLVATADTIISRFSDKGNQASKETREVMIQASAAMLNDKPLGVGWNNFGKAINHPYPYGDVIDDWNRERGQKVDEDYAKGVVENHYWLLLAETGYPGFIAYTLFIAYIAARCIILMISRTGSLEGALASGIFISTTLTYAHSYLERVLTQTKNLALWMLLIGLLSGLVKLSNNAKETK